MNNNNKLVLRTKRANGVISRWKKKAHLRGFLRYTFVHQSNDFEDSTRSLVICAGLPWVVSHTYADSHWVFSIPQLVCTDYILLPALTCTGYFAMYPYWLTWGIFPYLLLTYTGYFSIPVLPCGVFFNPWTHTVNLQRMYSRAVVSTYRGTYRVVTIVCKLQSLYSRANSQQVSQSGK